MNNSIYRLGLMGVVFSTIDKVDITQEQTPKLLEYLASQNVPTAKEPLSEAIVNAYEFLSRELDYYDSSELKVNDLVERYLVTVLENMVVGNPPSARDVSIMLCSLGNKNNDHDETSAVETVIETTRSRLSFFENPENLYGASVEKIDGVIKDLDYLFKVLSLIDVFVTSRLGMIAGLEEFAPINYDHLIPKEEHDFEVADLECSSEDDCPCGCAFNDSLKLLQGMEDYLEGSITEESIFFQDKVNTQSTLLELHNGSEGPIFDAIKATASKAYEVIMLSWKGVKEFFATSDKEADDAVVAKADDNKKAIQSMASKAAKINDKAMQGIKNLAAKVDTTGAMGKIVARLSGPPTAAGVIDGLLGLLNENSTSGKALQEKKKEAEAALAELKKASTSISGDETNKELAGEAKASIQEKTKAAKQAVADAKKLVADHNKLTKGIRNAINGITPLIFISETPSTDTDKKDNK